MSEIAVNANKQGYPRVSIIVVNYNGYRWLKLFMPSLLETQYPDFEIILVDNASKDESVQYLKDNFKQVRLITLSRNKGLSEGQNIGVSHSICEVLAFINNDMEVRPNWLLNAIQKLTSNPTIGAVQSKILRYYKRDEIDSVGTSVDRYCFFHNIGCGEPDKGQYDNLEEIGSCNGGAMVIWKHIFNEVGCFDSLFNIYHEDIDLSWRVRLAGYRICPAISSVVYHVGSATSNVRRLEGWSPSPFFSYINSRNIAYCWLKNSSSKRIIFDWPVFLLGNLLIAIFLTANVSPRSGFAYFSGLLWPVKNFRHILNQRKKLEPIIKNRKENILFVNGVIKESSNFSNMIKRAPCALKGIIAKYKQNILNAR